MEQKIKIDSISLNYSETGNPAGIPVLLMHGWGCNLTTLASIQKIMDESNKLRVVNIDFPGFGKSDEPTEVWGVEQYTSMVERFLDELGIENPIILGHSFGGRVSILMASRREIRKVILVDAAGVKPKHSLKWYAKVYSFKFAKRFYKFIYGAEKAQAKIDKARAKRGSSDYNNSTPMMRSILSRCVNEDLCDKMPLIKAPTLLIWGENDTATPLSDAQKMERLIPDSGLVSFPGCGHYSFLDNPFGFKSVIKEFLKEEIQ